MVFKSHICDLREKLRVLHHGYPAFTQLVVGCYMEVLLHCGEISGPVAWDIRKEILSAKFYPSVTLPTLEKVFLVSLIFPLDHMYDHMYDHIYDVYTMHKSIISVVNTMTIMYLCMASAVICLLSNVCLLFITNYASTPSSRWQRQSLYPFVTAS